VPRVTSTPVLDSHFPFTSSRPTHVELMPLFVPAGLLQGTKGCSGTGFSGSLFVVRQSDFPLLVVV
jgi:hypothetical protein